MLFKSYPHTNHKAIIFVKLRVSMWIIRRKNFFNFSLLPVARLNCYTPDEKTSGVTVLFSLFFDFYIMPPMPGAPAGIAGASSLILATADSVVNRVEATEVAF